MFSGKIYTADKNFTRPPVATVATNSKSANELKMTDLGGKGENVRAAESGDSANEIKTALNITTSTTLCSGVGQSIACWVRDKAPLITP